MTEEQWREFTEARIREHLDLVPEHMHDAVLLYVLDRVEPGGFLTAVLENNLKEAAVRADSRNARALADWGKFCVYALPTICWGDPIRVRAWLSREDLVDHSKGEE